MTQNVVAAVGVILEFIIKYEENAINIRFDEKNLKAFLCRFLVYFRPVLGHFKPLVSLANNEGIGFIHIESQIHRSHFFSLCTLSFEDVTLRITKHYSAFKTLRDGNLLLLDPDASGHPINHLQAPISVSSPCQRSVLADSLQGTRNQQRRHT